MMNVSKGECRRCGTCCEKGGPALHLADRQVVEQGRIPLRCLFTIRVGEPVRDDIRGGVRPSTSEIIKIKGRDGQWCCHFYQRSGNRCRIYADRPLECRSLTCWDTHAIESVYDGNRLTRKILLSDVQGLWPIAEDHDRGCAYGTVRTLVDALAGQNRARAAARLLDMLKYDKHLRLVVVEKAGVDPDMTDFLFGRPLMETIGGFGVKVETRGGKTVLKLGR